MRSVSGGGRSAPSSVARAPAQFSRPAVRSLRGWPRPARHGVRWGCGPWRPRAPARPAWTDSCRARRLQRAQTCSPDVATAPQRSARREPAGARRDRAGGDDDDSPVRPTGRRLARARAERRRQCHVREPAGAPRDQPRRRGLDALGDRAGAGTGGMPGSPRAARPAWPGSSARAGAGGSLARPAPRAARVAASGAEHSAPPRGLARTPPQCNVSGGSACRTGAGLGLQNRWILARATDRRVRFPCVSAILDGFEPGRSFRLINPHAGRGAERAGAEVEDP